MQQWLYTTLRAAIIDARLAPKMRLPGTRTLARHYGFARGTAQAVYELLSSEGYLVPCPGSGTYVAATLPDTALRVASLSTTSAVDQASPTNMPVGPWMKLLQEIKPAFPIEKANMPPRPFQPHCCDVRSFPVDVWRRLHARQLRSSRLHTFWDTTPGRLPTLRRAIAGYLALARGVHVSPEQIVIVNSTQQALDLSIRLLVAPGDRVWMEDPGYAGARQVLQMAGAKIIDLPVDSDGLRIGEGLSCSPEARFAYVTPSRQSPLGVSLNKSRRTDLLTWAMERGAYLFEDDYDSEFHFSARPIPALKSLPGGATHVILAGTFSKVLFPALRVAYVALPPQLVTSFTRAISLITRHVQGLTQAVLADFIDEGHFDRHIRRMRRIYALRAEAFQEAAHRHWKGLLDVPDIRAGLDVAVRLVSGNEAEMSCRLANAGIVATPLSWYSVLHQIPHGYMMGFAPFDEQCIEEAARRVAAALRDACSPPRPLPARGSR